MSKLNVYVNEREAFEEQVFQPPRTVRLMQELGRYVAKMDRADREDFTKIALDRFFELRARITKADDVRTVWIEALNQASATRATWRIWVSVYETKLVIGSRWRGADVWG